MIEVEIKAQIADPTLIRKKIVENQGSYKFSLIHKDIYFNMPKGLRDFKQTDEALRLRKSSRFNKSNPDIIRETEYFCTYKGRKLDALTKTRNEFVIKVDNIENMKQVFELLGFREVLTVNKERELFKLNFRDKTIEALIDYIPLLKQFFIEVEYLVKTPEEISASQEVLFDLLCQLGIKKEESIRKSYLELILEKIEGN